MLRRQNIVTALLASVVLAALAAPVMSAINYAYLVPGVSARPAGSIPKIVLLTFDDGPDATSVRIARYLAGEKIPAVFFLVGKKVKASPAEMNEIASYGFTIGNHSMDHADLSRADNERLKSEVEECSGLIQKGVGHRPAYFRPPYGSFSRRLVKTAQSQGLTTLLWTVDPFDWAEPGPDVIQARVLSAVHPGSVILLHSNHEQTLEALPGIIKGLRDKGYRFVGAQEWFSSVLGVSGNVAASQPEKRQPVELPKPKPAAAPLISPALSRKVQKHPTPDGEINVFTNIVDENALFAAFRSVGSQQAETKPAAAVQWQEELPARIVPEYRADFLLNRREFAETVYPQPAMFMLTALEELPSLDADFMRTLAMQGGITEVLVIEPSGGAQGEIGDFGVPAKYVTVSGFDPTAIYELSSGSASELLSLYEQKKEAIFILLGAKDFATPEARLNLENAAQLFLRFRQLTCEKLYDPGEDVRGSWLPEGASFARFTGAGGTLFVLSARASQTITLPRSMQSLSLISLPSGGEAVKTPLQGRSLMVSPDPLYLASD